MREVRGFTLIELLIVLAIISILAAIAIPNLLESRMSGNEASAIGSLRAVISAQVDYHNLNRGYADDLATLASPCGAPVVPPFLSSDLGADGITKSGYIFNLAPGVSGVPGPPDCNGVITQTDFYATAVPAGIGSTGHRAFAANAGAAIWQNTSGIPPPEPFTAGGTISPLAQ